MQKDPERCRRSLWVTAELLGEKYFDLNLGTQALKCVEELSIKCGPHLRSKRWKTVVLRLHEYGSTKLVGKLVRAFFPSG